MDSSQRQKERALVRDRICNLLIDAFYRTNKPIDAKTVQDYLNLEHEAYGQSTK